MPADMDEVLLAARIVAAAAIHTIAVLAATVVAEECAVLITAGGTNRIPTARTVTHHTHITRRRHPPLLHVHRRRSLP